MMSWGKGACAVAMLTFFAAPVSARDYYYFNKPGVDRATYLEDRLECDELAGGAARVELDHATTNQSFHNSNLTTGQAAVASGIASFFGALLSGARNRRLAWQIERICLADKGYRRFEIEKAQFKEIENLEDDGERIDRWFAMANSDEPIGTEMHE